MSGTNIKLCNSMNKIKTMDSPKSLKNIVPTLTLSREITGVEKREEKTKREEYKNLNFMTRTPDGMDLNMSIIIH